MSEKLGHFELLDQIGQGGMGTVFRAYDPSLNRNVAVKLLDGDLAKDPKFVKNFLREAQAAAAISHAQIVPIHFVGEQDGHYYIVMELLYGRPLNAIVYDGPLGERAALNVAINIAEALKAAYTKQMIHGDIKPQNIFVTESSGAKLLDFGLAKLANVDVTLSDGLWGSPEYASPEKIRWEAEDFRSDIYSLGATLFEALAGRHPFEGGTAEELTVKRLEEAPPLLRAFNPGLSERTEAIIDRMLAKNPEERYPDYDSLIDDLRKAEAALDARARPAKPPSGMLRPVEQPPAAKARKSSLSRFVASSLFAIFAGAVVALILIQGKNSNLAEVPTPGPGASTSPANALPAPNGTTIWDFKYRDNRAKTVLLAGNFNSWQPEPMTGMGDGNWILSRKLPRTVIIKYQYIVDGRRQPDPEGATDAVADENGVLKSVLVIPKVDATPPPQTSETRGPAGSRQPELITMDSPSPAPSPMPVEPSSSAGPSPMVAEASPPALPTPPAEPTPPPPPPAPMAFNLDALASVRADWPRTVTLTKPVTFPAVLDGKVVGEVKAVPGREVALVAMGSGQLVVELEGGSQRVPVDATNLVQSVEATFGHKYDTLPLPTPPAAPPGN